MTENTTTPSHPFMCTMNLTDDCRHASPACFEEFDTATERAAHQALVHPLQFADRIRRAVARTEGEATRTPAERFDVPFDAPLPQGGAHNTKPGVAGETQVSTDVPAEPMTEAEATDLVLARFRSEKLEVADVDRRMVDFATAWAAAWNGGDFQFMVDMRANAKRGRLSVGMAKGVWNCYRADVLRNERTAKKAATPAPVKSDYEPKKFDVHFVDGEYYRIHISQSTGNPYACKWVVDGGFDVQHGAHKSGSFQYEAGAIRKLSTATLVTAEQAAAFGHAFHRCCFCATPIDTPESEAVGYGPKCAADRGLPWGNH